MWFHHVSPPDIFLKLPVDAPAAPHLKSLLATNPLPVQVLFVACHFFSERS